MCSIMACVPFMPFVMPVETSVLFSHTEPKDDKSGMQNFQHKKNVSQSN